MDERFLKAWQILKDHFLIDSCPALRDTGADAWSIACAAVQENFPDVWKLYLYDRLLNG